MEKRWENWERKNDRNIKKGKTTSEERVRLNAFAYNLDDIGNMEFAYKILLVLLTPSFNYDFAKVLKVKIIAAFFILPICCEDQSK